MNEATLSLKPSLKDPETSSGRSLSPTHRNPQSLQTLRLFVWASSAWLSCAAPSLLPKDPEWAFWPPDPWIKPSTPQTFSAQLQPSSQDCSFPTRSPGTQVIGVRSYVRVTRGGHWTPFLLPTLPCSSDCFSVIQRRDWWSRPYRRSTKLLKSRQTWKCPVAWGMAQWSFSWATSICVHALAPHSPSYPPKEGRKEEPWIDKTNGGFTKKLTWVYKK